MRPALVAVVALLLALPAAAQAGPLLRTAGDRAFCDVDEDATPVLTCWEPRFGETLRLARGVRASYVPANRARRPGGYPPLADGQTLAWPDPAAPAFTCASRASGLTCLNPARVGFWLGPVGEVWRWHGESPARTYVVQLDRLVERPRRVVQGAHGGFVGLRWSSWSRRGATARGTFDYADRGTRWRVPVRLRYLRPRTCANGLTVFTRRRLTAVRAGDRARIRFESRSRFGGSCRALPPAA